MPASHSFLSTMRQPLLPDAPRATVFCLGTWSPTTKNQPSETVSQNRVFYEYTHTHKSSLTLSPRHLSQQQSAGAKTLLVICPPSRTLL